MIDYEKVATPRLSPSKFVFFQLDDALLLFVNNSYALCQHTLLVELRETSFLRLYEEVFDFPLALKYPLLSS
jgi:hypothetical protein